MFDIFKPDEPKIGVVIGTGQSLTKEQIDKARKSGALLIGVNRAFEFDVDVLVGCNWQFWHHYWPQVKDLRCDKWATLDHDKVKHLDVNLIESRFMDGLSTDPSYIAHHHGSGPMAINIALHYGCKKIILIGWDMRYPGKVDRYTYTGKRHFFGEDALTEKHWPIFIGEDGTLNGLMKGIVTIHPSDYDIEIINCTPNSAMTHFPMMDLDEALENIC